MRRYIQKIIFLGTGAAMPTNSRFTSSVLMKTSTGSNFLFDCGEGIQLQIAKTKSLSKVSHIFITHLHGDHFFGVFGLLCTLLNFIENFKGIKVIGPVGIKKAVCTVLKQGSNEEEIYKEKVKFLELDGDENLDISEHVDGFKVYAIPLKHTIKCYGYVIEEYDKVGKLLIDKIDLKNFIDIEKSLLADLKMEKDVVLSNGVVIRSSDVLSEKEVGRKYAFLQDTCNSDKGIELLQGCDILIHECTFSSVTDSESDAVLYGHSNTQMAGSFAQKVNAKVLFLTHFSQKYRRLHELLALKDEVSLVCPETKVVIAKDLMVIEEENLKTNCLTMRDYE